MQSAAHTELSLILDWTRLARRSLEKTAPGAFPHLAKIPGMTQPRSHNLEVPLESLFAQHADQHAGLCNEQAALAAATVYKLACSYHEE